MQLKSLADMLDMVQRDNAKLADACRVRLILAEDENLTPDHNAAAKRMKSYLQSFYYLSCITYPDYKGEMLDYEQGEAA